VTRDESPPWLRPVLPVCEALAILLPHRAGVVDAPAPVAHPVAGIDADHPHIILGGFSAR